MTNCATALTVRRPLSGWAWVGGMALLYAALYALNYWLPLERNNYTTRIWRWSQLALTAGACIAIVMQRRHLDRRTIILGLGLGVVSGLSHMMHNPSLWGGLEEALSVWACFVGGLVLLKGLDRGGIAAFKPPLATLGRSLLFGIAVALPLAIVNNLYFFATVGHVQLQPPLISALTALSPGIHEEVIFRFFVLALCLRLLQDARAQRLALLAAVVLAVVPHSLNHLPDLFLASPTMAATLLVATSLLFGLPMAFLQLWRNLETAIAFHWFIDFARFFFGF